jgi:hypothetical protein
MEIRLAGGLHMGNFRLPSRIRAKSHIISNLKFSIFIEISIIKT